MRFIQLPPKEPRCRPDAPFAILHNDCGMQDRCARRLAANTTGAPAHDYSRKLRQSIYDLSKFDLCIEFMSADKAAELVRTR